MSGKLVIFGNCQGLALEQALRGLPHVTERFQVIRHDTMLDGEALDASLPDYADADVILVQQILRWRTHPMRERLNPSARIVPYPALAHMALWPFDSFIEGPDPAFVFEQPFIFGDHLMARLRGSVLDPAGSVPDPVERLRIYKSLEWPSAPDRAELKRNQSFDASRMLRLDEKMGSRLGRFILDHYRRQPLFHAIHHPNQTLMVEFAAEVLAKAGLYTDAVRELDLDVVGFNQVPIHPLVAEALELEWATPDRKYLFRDGLRLDFDAYYAGYIDAYG